MARRESSRNRVVPLSNFRVSFAAVALAAWSSPALALLPAIPVDKTCPYSGEKIQITGIGSMLVSGGTFDMRPLVMGIVPPPSPIAGCADGFLFYKYDFTPAELAELKPLI